MLLLISYDLNGHERPSAYHKIQKIITDNAPAIKPMYSQWLVDTSKTPDQWVDLLKPALDNDDKVLVVKLVSPYQGIQEKSVWNWISSRI